MADMPTRALVYAAPRVAVIGDAVARDPSDGEARIRVIASSPSRGTERLVFEGRVPETERERMRAPFQIGAFPFPVIYGYAAVGVVEDGPEAWRGRRVFALAPHIERITLPLAALTPLPDTLPTPRATLAANLETALNVLWDGGLGPGDRVAVVGAGVVGCLVAGLAAATPGVEVTLVDPQAERAEIARRLGAAFATPEAVGALEADLVVHASASAAGLATALSLAGEEACVIEASWYGAAKPEAPLGAAFHARRLRLVSSQVGRVAPSRRPRWSHARRLAKAVDMLADPRYDALLTGEVDFDALPAALPALLAPGAPGLATVVRYPGADAAPERREG